MKLSEAIYSTDPYSLFLQKESVIFNDDVQMGLYVIENYGNNKVCTQILDEFLEKNPSLVNEVLNNRDIRILIEDGAGDKLNFDKDRATEKSGGILQRIGARAKAMFGSITNTMYKLRTKIWRDEDDEKAQRDYEKILNKYDSTSELSIKKLDKGIRADIIGFPNCGPGDVKKSGDANPDFKDLSPHALFINGLARVASVYDTVVQRHTEGAISTEQANIVISDLRALANKYSKELQSVYTKLESKNRLADVLLEAEEENSLNIKSGEDTAQTAANRKQIWQKALLAAGLSSLTVGLLFKYGIAQKIVDYLFPPAAPNVGETDLSEMGPDHLPPVIEEVVTQSNTMGASYALLKENGGPFTAEQIKNLSGAEGISAFAKLDPPLCDAAGKPTDALLSSWKDSGQDVTKSTGIWNETVANPENTSKKFSEFWGASKNIALTSMFTKVIGGQCIEAADAVKDQLVKGAVTAAAATGGGLAAAAKTGLAFGTAAAPWLIGIGLGAAAIGGAWLYLKKKGLKTSRASATQGLINIMEDLTAPEKPVEPIPPPSATPDSAPTTSPSLMWRADIDIGKTDCRTVGDAEYWSPVKLERFRKTFDGIEASNEKSWYAHAPYKPIESMYYNDPTSFEINPRTDASAFRMSSVDQNKTADGPLAIKRSLGAEGIMFGIATRAASELQKVSPQLVKERNVRKLIMSYLTNGKAVERHKMKEFITSDMSFNGIEGLDISLDDDASSDVLDILTRMGIVRSGTSVSESKNFCGINKNRMLLLAGL